MIDLETKERLIEQFRASLDTDAGEMVDVGETLDLHTLLAEMAALKNETRLQARQFKAALEQMQALSEALGERNERLLRDLERARSEAADAKARAERSLLLGLLELRDRLQAGLDAQIGWRPSPLQRLMSGERRFAQSLREGSTLTLQRLDELLGRYGVRAIAAVGQVLDPQCMHAVTVEWVPHATEGVVLRELRRGFYQGSELLRAAEVIVNKASFNERANPA
jgi:molecular chaperone GrpE